MSIPYITGSIYTGDKSTEDVVVEIDSENQPLSENENSVFRVSDICYNDPKPQTKPVIGESSHDHLGTGSQKTLRRKRRSYSLEDGIGRYSLDGSRKNSLLTVTGDMEIDISLPQSVRRSFSGLSSLSF
eukprot:UN23412